MVAEVLATALELVTTDRPMLRRCEDVARDLEQERRLGCGEASAACLALASLEAGAPAAAPLAELPSSVGERGGEAGGPAPRGATSEPAVGPAVPPRPPATWQEVDLPGGLHVACLSRSEAFFLHREIFSNRCYQRRGISLPPGAVVVDAGANIGLFSLSLFQGWPSAQGHAGGQQQAQRAEQDAAEQAGGARPLPAGCSGARPAALDAWPSAVWAFEPVPQIADVLEHNVAAHALGGRVRDWTRCISPPALPEPQQLHL